MSRPVCLGLLATLVLAGCATLPEKVAPTPMAGAAYQGQSCASLDAERRKLDTAYEQASQRQMTARKGDAVGLALVGLPLFSLTGHSQTKTIGEIKGRQEALSEAYRVADCGGA